jgi:hypothetical protein
VSIWNAPALRKTGWLVEEDQDRDHFVIWTVVHPEKIAIDLRKVRKVRKVRRLRTLRISNTGNLRTRKRQPTGNCPLSPARSAIGQSPNPTSAAQPAVTTARPTARKRYTYDHSRKAQRVAEDLLGAEALVDRTFTVPYGRTAAPFMTLL